MSKINYLHLFYEGVLFVARVALIVVTLYVLAFASFIVANI